MSYDFKPAEPVAIVGTGSKKQPNPFTEAVAGIAWKNGKDGKPLALSFVEEHEADEAKAIRGRIRAKMKDAGNALAEPGTVRTAFEDVAGGTKCTFWVVKLQTRARKPKSEEAPVKAK